MLDAPVSGGVAGAAGGTLTFMVGGEDAAFAQRPADPRQHGQDDHSCRPQRQRPGSQDLQQLMLGVSMIAVSEAFALADRLGLDAQRLFEISSKSSGQCWSMTSYCPVPGPVPSRRRTGAIAPVSQRR